MRISETIQIAPIVIPIDLAAGANTGDWINVSNYQHFGILYLADVGTAGEDPVITVLQATDNAGTGSKALNFTRIATKQGATALSAVGTFTNTTQSSANTYSSATGGENEELYLIEFDAADLDVSGGFDHISVTIADPGTAGKLGTVIFLGNQARYAQAVTPSAL